VLSVAGADQIEIKPYAHIQVLLFPLLIFFSFLQIVLDLGVMPSRKYIICSVSFVVQRPSIYAMYWVAFEINEFGTSSFC
jgi:hypothetical protein